MNIYYWGIFIGVLIGLAVAAFYKLFKLAMMSEEEIINEWRKEAR